jgi:hypothetical protein
VNDFTLFLWDIPFSAIFMEVYIIFMIAVKPKDYDPAALANVFSAFQAVQVGGIHPSMRYSRLLVLYLFPAFPAHFAKSDPFFKIRIDPAQQLVKVEGIMGIFYVLLG